jgi:hypothetical protein
MTLDLDDPMNQVILQRYEDMKAENLRRQGQYL